RELDVVSPSMSELDEYDAFTTQPPIVIDCSPLSWWLREEQQQTYPRLSRMAVDILSIPAMSAEPERFPYVWIKFHMGCIPYSIFHKAPYGVWSMDRKPECREFSDKRSQGGYYMLGRLTKYRASAQGCGALRACPVLF
ncbi:inner membrane protease subunit 1, partial [Fusarium oxysporum f. sp. albedinis]